MATSDIMMAASDRVVFSARPTTTPKPLYRRIATLLIVSVATTALLLLDDRLQQLVTSNNLAALRPSWIGALMLIVTCLWLGGSRIAANTVIGLFAVMQLFQLCHIGAIGRPLTPLDVAMIPLELDDIAVAARASFSANWPTLFAGGIPYLLTLLIFNIGLPRLSLPRMRWALVVVALVLGAQPYNAGRRNMTHYLPQPERSSLHNSVLVFSYYAANLIGQPVRRRDAEYLPYRIERRTDAAAASQRPRTIWLVIFDSTRIDRWGVAGYSRPTTPTMSHWVAEGQARWHRGIAGAASTRASMTLLFNSVREPGNLRQLRSHESNLFRLAKGAGYRTYWISTQHGDLLEDIDPTSIDVKRTKDTDPALVRTYGDDAALTMLDGLVPGESRVVVLMLRTAHIPYDDAYRRQGSRFLRWPTDGFGSDQRLNNSYDNAILYQDDLVARLYRRFEQLDEQGVFVVTSDHGQMLGDDGVWGHNVLTPQIAQVPILMRSRGPAQPPLGKNGEWIAHYELARTLASRMGYTIDNPNAQAGLYYLQGSYLFGDNLFRETRISGGRMQMGELSGLGHSRAH
jgi:glucan phosphoethanolaminetransferase (alkaline phosphatase superfamily)